MQLLKMVRNLYSEHKKNTHTQNISYAYMYSSTRRHKFLLTPPTFPSEDKKKVSTCIIAYYLAFLQLLEPLCAPSPSSLLDKDYLKSGTEET